MRGAVEGPVNVFRGIPYAGDVTGPARFRPPPPARPWRGTLDATRFGPSPVQGVRLRDHTPIAEQCLTLNVWAPPDARDAPVYVWIYGGSNVGGTSAASAYDGTTFARAGIVCVTLNYREGCFGFLALQDLLGPDYAQSGNVAILDQIAALRWVRDNIAAFGGNPDHIVLGGESAGAKNVMAVATSPMTRGMVRGLIVESGGGQTVFSPAEAAAVTVSFCRANGIDPRNAGSLRTMPAEQLLAMQERFWASPPCRFPFRSVIDGVVLTEAPIDAVQRGVLQNVPMMIGTNADESHMFLPEARAGERPRRNDVAHLDPVRLPEIEAAYDAAFADLADKDRHWRLITAEEYWIPSIRLAEAQARTGAPVWMYRFDAPATSGRFAGLAPHASELPYVWDIAHSNVTRVTNGAQLAPSGLPHEMHARWVAFIRGLSPDGVVNWPRYGEHGRDTMIFNISSRIEQDPRGKERRLWSGLL